MTIYSSIYTSLTGMVSYSDALNVLSDNIANMNTPGFKGNDVLFRDLPPSDPTFEGGSGSMPLTQFGNGSEFFGTHRNFSEGPFESTGNSTDLSINGNGFFVLNDNGQQVFSQAGQFTFDNQGYLIDSATHSRVQGYSTVGGPVGDIQVPPQSFSPAVASSKVTFSGTLNSAVQTGSTGATATATVGNVIDASGTAHTLTVNFTLDTSSSTSGIFVWDVDVTDEKGNDLTPGGTTITFNSSSPDPSNDAFTVSIGGQVVDLDFSGASTQDTGSTSSTISGTANGTPSGSLTSITFDQNGTIQLAFSNGVTKSGPQLAIATFSNPDALINIGTSLFQANPNEVGGQPSFGTAGNNGYGQIQPGQLELSNVNLSDQFSIIVVLQNGYQGSSQVLNVANELLSDLYKSVSGSSSTDS